jgi:arylsulfatase A-like enzyme
MVTNILVIAMWFGLVTGLVEGAGFVFFQKLGWLGWERSLSAVSLEIIWLSTLFNLLLFSMLGLLLSALAYFLPKLVLTWKTVFLFAFLMFYDWVSLTGRIHEYSALILGVGTTVAFTRWFSKHDAVVLYFWRRSLPCVAIVALLALIGIQGGLWMRERIAIAKLPVASLDAPNILVIVLDALRADHLSSYGYGLPTSPNLDRIAQQGVLFENAFATSSWSPPSHASLLTGRYLYEHGVEWNRALDNRYPTLAESLRARGYRTGAFSANWMWFSRRWGFGRGFILFDDYFHSIGDVFGRTLYGRKVLEYRLLRYRRLLGFDDHPMRRRASDINRSFLRWIKHDSEKPFFVFLNYIDTHWPYLPPTPYRYKFLQSNKTIGNYDDAIAYVDDHIGQLLTELQRRKLAKNTLVVITSDHGESLGEHGLSGHRNALYREEIHVPLIFRWPGHVPAGVRMQRPVTNAAIPATVMDLVDAGDQTLFPGPSLTQLWEDPESHSNWPYPLAEIAQAPFEEHKKLPIYHGWMKSLVSPKWHYIENEKLGAELYDWNNDPQELYNLVTRPEVQGVVKRFQAKLQQFMSDR